MKRRTAIATSASLLAGGWARAQAPRAQAKKVLRYAFNAAETGFDPAKVFDLYSRIVTAHIFENLYNFDPLARPAKIKPAIADGPAAHSADFRTWTVKIKRGVFFADDPAFKGRKRELTAADFVYAMKRFVDPANKSPASAGVLDAGMLGLGALRERALKDKAPFDYDTGIEGLRALDRYTVQYKLDKPRPRFAEGLLTSHDLFGAVAREVVEAYGEDIAAHPVGTGPFRLVQWRRSSLIVLERNPDYREVFYEAEPAADDAEGQAFVARFKGRRLPMVDRVEVSIIEESQPRWLGFLSGQLDFVNVPLEFANQALPGGKLAPNLAKRGMRLRREVEADSAYTYFNMDDPVVGGYTPDKVALRRAIGLAMNVPREIGVVRRNQAIPAQSPILPHTSGYDPTFKCEMGDHDPIRAKALLDLYGYIDRNGDGFRERPDGQPLVLEFATQSDALSRVFDELLQKSMEAVGIRVRFAIGQWPEQLKQARAGKLMLWQLGGSAASLDGAESLQRYHSAQIGGQNFARFKHKRFDELYDRLLVIEDGPERQALFREAKLIAAAFMPYKFQVHRISNDLAQPWLIGHRRHVAAQDWWHLVDIDESKKPTTT
ncbi:MAG TPA: ABC transporter substrate-binding protein [Burkholderiaceae bacterium]|nr:ABC transporter substrate-binding protein [Burkholderiaceae bacterium]